MKIQTKYIIFVAVLHLVALVLSYFVFESNKVIFLFAEVFIILSIFISYQIYQELIKPLQLLVQGTEAIADRDFNVRFNSTGTYEMDKLITVYNNMMEQLRQERVRQEEQHYFLEKLIFTSPTGIMVLDFDAKVQQVNPAALRLLGVNESALINHSLETMNHPVLQKVIQMSTGTSATVRPDGVSLFKLHKSHFVDRGFPRHFVMMEVLTHEILEAEKGAYGKVIRMMAHEVNNTIGPVNSIMQSALGSVGKSDSPVSDALQVAIDRNNNLNIFMRNFADLVRLPPPSKQLTDIGKLLDATTHFMQHRSTQKEIDFQLNLPVNPLVISVDPQQMEQVLINIIKNASEAISRKGTVWLNLYSDKKLLTITDDGQGISDENTSKIFEPFFSTKKDGQGIGLTLIREILTNHGFVFSLKRNKDGFTEFMIRFS